MKKILNMIAMILIACMVLSGCGKADESDAQVKPNAPAETAKAEEITYSKDAEIFVYNAPTPESLAQEEKIAKGTVLKLLDRKSDFYHVAYDVKGEQKEGYIPVWYLDDDKAPLCSLQSDYQVLKENTTGFLYPYGPKAVGLEEGKLLRPFMESEDWVQVDIMVYDIPAVLRAWVKKDSLAATDKMQPKEGFIPSEAELFMVDGYKDIQGAKPVKEDYPKNVFIIKREGGYAYVGAAGGWTAWVEEKWIRYTDKDLK